MVAAQHTTLDHSNESSTAALFGAAVGDINRAFYMAHFARFDTRQRPHLSWNWAAALTTVNWLIFRQMWQALGAYLATVLAIGLCFFGIGQLVFDFSQGMQWGLLLVYMGLLVVIPGAGANALYYLATRKRVQEALARNETAAQACQQLARQSSSRKGLILLCVANVLLAVLAIQSYAVLRSAVPLQTGASTQRLETTSSGPVATGQAEGAHTAPATPAALVPAVIPAPTSAPAAPSTAPTVALPLPSPPPPTADRQSRAAPPERQMPVPMRSAAAERAAREVAQARRQAPGSDQPATAP
ncbi:MAG: DUF2628 domain-containing protein [Rhodoferax sp.]|nr:DUF2628 domain-containing protein [Rhodoferax sp.]